MSVRNKFLNYPIHEKHDCMSALDAEKFLHSIEIDGFYVHERAISPDLISGLRSDLLVAIEKEAELRGGRESRDYGMLLACPVYGGKFLQLVEQQSLFLPFDWILGPNSIIYVYTSSCMPPHAKNYTSRIHVDRPHHIPGFVEAMGCLILLDDFTEDNGATWVLPGSHLTENQPDEPYFYANATRILAPKGSILYFNLRLWHAGGINTTDDWRCAIGIGMVRPYLKQRIDLPLALEKSNVDLTSLTKSGLQRLGFHSRPPSSLEEYCAPPDMRPYRQASEWSGK